MTTQNNPPVEVQHKAVVLAINQLYKPEMKGRALYETARAAWVVDKRREQAEYAIAVCHGIAMEVYSIDKWLPAFARRWKFEGEVAEEEVRRLYLWNEIYVGGKSVKGLQNPVRYANI